MQESDETQQPAPPNPLGFASNYLVVALNAAANDLVAVGALPPGCSIQSANNESMIRFELRLPSVIQPAASIPQAIEAARGGPVPVKPRIFS